jgi:hypothetical protein
VLNSLREAFSRRKRNAQISREIEEGKPLGVILPESIENDIELHLDSRWWLEKFFDRHKLSFVQGALLVYLIISFPRALIALYIWGRIEGNLLNVYISTFFGGLYIPIALILIHNIYKVLVKLNKTINRDLKEKRFVAPPHLLSENELDSQASLDNFDKEYTNRYIKPVVIRTLQSGINLPFDGNYQLGSGIIASSLFLFIMYLRLGLNVLPQNVFIPTDFGSAGLNTLMLIETFFMVSIDWFIVGMVAWTLFTTFLCTIQAAGNPIKLRPFESIPDKYASISALVFRSTFAITFMVVWVSPFVLLWSILPPDPLVRQWVTIFVEAVLLVMIPVIILSFFIPIVKTHKGMAESRGRLLVIKSHQLEEIKKIRESDPSKYLRIQKHLIQDYKDVQENPVWLITFQQGFQIVGSIILPIVSFLISIQI